MNNNTKKKLSYPFFSLTGSPEKEDWCVPQTVRLDFSQGEMEVKA